MHLSQWAKAFQTTLWNAVHSLPWEQWRRWILAWLKVGHKCNESPKGLKDGGGQLGVQSIGKTSQARQKGGMIGQTKN
jgi:hypothetical protein